MLNKKREKHTCRLNEHNDDDDVEHILKVNSKSYNLI